MRIDGILFDMDGTLVDTHQHYPAMKAELGLNNETPLLETLAARSEEDRAEAMRILAKYEQIGIDTCQMVPGARAMLDQIGELGLRSALVTRNSRQTTDSMLAKMEVTHLFDAIYARCDGPPKPDPWAIDEICREWATTSERLIMVGDFHYDILFGRNGGARTVMVCRGRTPDELKGTEEADFLLDNFVEVDNFWRWVLDPEPEHLPSA